MDVTVTVPKGMTNQQVADTFAAYLLGSELFGPITQKDRRASGPYPKDGEGVRWQLDHSNDYFLRIEDGVARLTSRYGGIQDSTIEAMAQLFRATVLLESTSS